ncbi:nematode cuticle collagen domain protein [Ancylostoma duodenale]|uniref:Nematode cuticle collagen domain protein n=1 Tax=Ancylostoma duodenale TaxID=51022 RepID=A0A0C2GPI7_9BILA|nr:nematode cuticle collagen domain protein [Ancylostoma duodenale]
MSVQRYMLAATCGGSALAIAAALCLTLSLLTEINSFYDEVIIDIGEFKVRDGSSSKELGHIHNFYLQGYADDAWKQMLLTTGGDRSPYSVLLARTRRDYQIPPTGIEHPPESGSDAAKSASPEGAGGAPMCNCAAQSGKCPAGPPGPPGQPGSPGG